MCGRHFCEKCSLSGGVDASEEPCAIMSKVEHRGAPSVPREWVSYKPFITQRHEWSRFIGAHLSHR